MDSACLYFLFLVQYLKLTQTLSKITKTSTSINSTNTESPVDSSETQRFQNLHVLDYTDDNYLFNKFEVLVKLAKADLLSNSILVKIK